VAWNREQLRVRIHWSGAYRPDWDGAPGNYVEEGFVNWAKSRRLGLLQFDAIKAYVGVQHIDPVRPGWNIVDRPEARFFVSFFVAGQCIALRTAATLDAALDLLLEMLRSSGVSP
jgi:hypothetical protein